MKKRKLLMSVAALLLAIVFIITFIASVFPVNAQTLSQQLTEAKNQKKAAEQQLAQIQSQKKSAETDKQAIDAEIAELNNKIAVVSAEIDSTKLKLSEKERELSAAEEACTRQFDSFKTRARVMYENGSTTYIEILFSSGSFSEFLSNLEIMRQLLAYDTKVLSERKAAREVIASQKAEIEAIKSEQEAGMQALAEMQGTLKVKQASQDAIINNLKSREETIRREVEEQTAEENRIQALINSVVSSSSQKSGTQSAVYSGSGDMLWPCPSTKRLTSVFATREHPIDGVTKMHNGIDIAGGYGADIIASASGTVLFSGNSSSYGKYIVLSHGNGITTLYAHCNQLLVSAGATVTKGQVIAKVGSTGKSTGPHLHFEVSVNGTRQNPLNYVK